MKVSPNGSWLIYSLKSPMTFVQGERPDTAFKIATFANYVGGSYYDIRFLQFVEQNGS